MRRSFLTVLLGAVFAIGCSSSDGPTTTCGENTQSVNGVCETIVTCGDGTTLVNNVCQPQAGAGACAEGTQNVDGRCVPAAEACDEGTRFVDGECVADLEVVCGAGTQANDDGECEPVEDVSCGPGTVPNLVSSDDGKTDVLICELQCTGDQIYDEVAEACVEACVDGAEFDSSTNTCRALCADDQFFSTELDGCVDVPVCLRNSTDDNGDAAGGDCAGWPFQELSLETFCARRAFNICDPILDPACGCDHAGDYFSNSDAGVFSQTFPQDFAGCLMEEITICDIFMGVSFLRALEDEGQITVDAEALADVDDLFALEEGVCTRPSDYNALPTEELIDAVVGTAATGEPCLHDLACSDTDHCRFEEEEEVVEAGLLPPIEAICQPRAALNEECSTQRITPRGGINLIPGDPTSAILCQEDLLCLANDELERFDCQEPIELGAACANDAQCEEGLFCFPADMDLIDSSSYIFASERTCQSPQSEGVGCLADSRTISGISVSQDVCQSNLRCDDSDQAPDGDGVGNCVAAFGGGQDCTYCEEYQTGISLFSSQIDQYAQDPFSVCGAELVCTFEALEEGFDESCEGNISVCPPRAQEVLGLGGVCRPFEFVCDDGLDEDGDSDVDCADSDCVGGGDVLLTEVCLCEDELDNDDDGDFDCDDSDCAAVEACQ